MNANTWGISGPDFLLVYIGLTLGLAVLFWRRRRAAQGQAPDASRLTALAPEEVAYLAGGGDRALATATVSLHRQGVLEVGADAATWRMSGPAQARGTGLESAVVRAVEGGIKPWSLRHDAQVQAELARIGRRLEDTGLVVDEARRRAASRGAWVFGLLLLVGVLRLVAGWGNHKPIMVLALWLPVVFGLWIWAMVRPARIPRATNALLGVWRSQIPVTSPTTALPQALIAGALLGWSGSRLLPTEAPLIAASATPGASAGSGTSSCGGGSGGDGGGGGGGGCGGCGGCGG